MALSHGYFDESGTHKQGPVLCFSGYLFTSDNAISFDEKWRAMLAKFRLRYFHMKEIHAPLGVGVFGDLAFDKRDLAAREAIEIIKTHAACGVMIGVDKCCGAALRASSLWKNDYSFVAWQAMYGVRDYMARLPAEDRVVVTIESGVKGAGDITEAFGKIMRVDEGRRFKLSKIVSSRRECDVALQAADMLAWHTNKFIARKREGKPRRKDLVNLLNVPTTFHYYDQEAVDELSRLRRFAD